MRTNIVRQAPIRTNLVHTSSVMRQNSAFYGAYLVGMIHAESTLQKGAFDQLCLFKQQNWPD